MKILQSFLSVVIYKILYIVLDLYELIIMITSEKNGPEKSTVLWPVFVVDG